MLEAGASLLAQCRGHGSAIGSGRTPHTMEHVSPSTTAAEPTLWTSWSATRAASSVQPAPHSLGGRSHSVQLEQSPHSNKDPARGTKQILEAKTDRTKARKRMSVSSIHRKCLIAFPRRKFIFKWKFNKYIVRMSHCIIWVIALLGYSLCTDFKIHALLNIQLPHMIIFSRSCIVLP